MTGCAPDKPYTCAKPLTAPLLVNRPLPGGHGLLRLKVGKSLAARVLPGHFAQLVCDGNLTLPRPFSIMDVDLEQGSVEILYRIVGAGTGIMAGWQGGEEIPLLLPLGRGFTMPNARANVLLIAGGVGLAPLHFLARRLAERGQEAVLVWGIETEAPLRTIDARLDAFPSDVPFVEAPRALANLDALGVSSRLASLAPVSGRFQGYVTALAERYLKGVSESERSRTVIYACGPTPMLKAVQGLAMRHGLRGEVSLEERMACGFGVCAACVAPIRGDGEGVWHYKKICTEGPVFEIGDVTWERY
ncbi:MAG: dihydroorotate dehydrogenase electron transfer subunit [Magnetococcales bacterium]|nr:dihydroorotate dehydrogenase electron transfer subunit [Magnetococcales bacterium]